MHIREPNINLQTKVKDQSSDKSGANMMWHATQGCNATSLIDAIKLLKKQASCYKQW